MQSISMYVCFFFICVCDNINITHNDDNTSDECTYIGVGMRYEKRSPYRFFGTRGKKNPRWEMRGKFVGVRGKKWSLAPRMPYDELLRH